jgi:hypothetical protein
MVRSLQSRTTQLCRTLRATQKALNGRSIIQEWRTAAVYISVSHEIKSHHFLDNSAFTSLHRARRLRAAAHRESDVAAPGPDPIAGRISEVVEEARP